MGQFSEKEKVILRKKFGIAHTLKDAWFVDDAPHVQEMKDLLEEGKNIYVWGKPGVGKTFAASVLLQQKIADEIEERFVHFRLLHIYDLEEEFRKSRRFDYEGDDPLMPAKMPTVLVLDDLGAEKPTEAMVNMLKRVLDYREERNLQTIFLSNFNKKDLVVRFNSLGADNKNVGAVSSRIDKNCRVIHIEGKDRRLEQ